jgi:hypothetical protein
MLGPFEILSIGSNNRYCKLKLPDHWKLHPVFNIDLLERYKETDPKKQIIEIEADTEDCEMETIVASRPSDHNPKQHVFLVKWKDYTQEENTWETYENIMTHNEELMEDYYVRNPTVAKDERFEMELRKRENGKELEKMEDQGEHESHYVILKLFYSTVEVTGLREGGDVRGCP